MFSGILVCGSGDMPEPAGDKVYFTCARILRGGGGVVSDGERTVDHAMVTDGNEITILFNPPLKELRLPSR